MKNFKNYKRKLRWKSTIRKNSAGMDPSCPKCGSAMHWRDSASLGGMWPEGAWECSNQRCWHMMSPGELAPDTVPTNLGEPGQGHRACPQCGQYEIYPDDTNTCRNCGHNAGSYKDFTLPEDWS